MKRKTFACDESMIITIPIGSLSGAREGELMPEKFQCVYKDFYKVFVLNGKPRPLGAAQAIAGIFILMLGLLWHEYPKPYGNLIVKVYTLPSVLFVVCGMLSFAAGQSPNMHMTKLSFSLNIISFFWSIAAACICGFAVDDMRGIEFLKGINSLILALLVLENLIALFLIYWLSKAVCRQHFNYLPIILLKQQD